MIQSYSCGSMEIKNRLYTRDLKIVDGQVFDGWYREGDHQISVEDVGDILSSTPEIVIFGTGHRGQMKVTNVLKNTLRRRNIEFIEAPTSEARDTFNRMMEAGRKVAGAFHLNC